MILSKSIKHGWDYHYKIETEKVETVQRKGFTNLATFLHTVRKERPDTYFTDGPRSSQIKTPFNISYEKTPHKVCYFARMGVESNYYDDNHMNVQMFMLGYDTQTFAMEVPVWIEPKEVKKYEDIFNTDKPLTGHIDLLGVEKDNIWIWDYKPKAHNEKKAHHQVLLYTFMIHLRTGIPLQRLKCGYFDDKNAYAINPESITNLNKYVKTE